MSKTKLSQAISLCGMPVYLSKYKGLDSIDIVGMILNKDPCLCPYCKIGILIPKYYLLE